MDITLLHSEDCPNSEVADERLRVVASERGDVRLTHQLVETPAEAERTGFQGSASILSPSILIDGVDVFTEPDAEVGLTCRRYRTPDGFHGAPTLEQLRTVLADA